MSVTASLVNELRQKTGAGMMDCKKALQETEGNLEKAIQVLRTKGLSKAAKKSGRIAAEGVVHSYIHAGGQIGVLCEVNCETDFVAKTDEFKDFVRDICLHIAANNPQYISAEEVPESVLNKEREIAIETARKEGKPENILDKIADGKVKKYYGEICLLDQTFVKDPNKKVSELLTERISKIGENIKVRRFARFEMGEGLEKKQEDFASEVAAQMGS